MQITIISDGYPSPGLPYSAFIGNIAREMTRQGCRVVVVAPQSLTKHWMRHIPLAPKYFEDIVECNGTIRQIAIYRPYTITAGDGVCKWITNWCNRIATTITLHKLPKPDYLYCHFWLNAVLGIDFAKRFNIPLVASTGEDKIPIEQISHKDCQWLVNNAHAVIAVSTKNKNESIQLGLAKPDKCHVIPNAYDPREFYLEDGKAKRDELGLKQDDFVVAFCGRFNHRKGVFRLDEALKSLNNPQIHAIYIGSPKDNCTEVPNYDRIAFMGNLPHEEIVHYLNAADVFVLPSLAEGCPNSVIEAMACGLPIISSNLPFNDDILNDNNSIRINPDSINDIASAIIKTMNTKERNRIIIGVKSTAQALSIDKRTNYILKIINK